MAPKKPEKPNRPEVIDANKEWEELNKLMGGSTFFRADEALEFDLDVIPFHSFALGEACKIFGAPKGKILQFHGAQGSGKSFMALLQILKAQEEPGTEQMIIDTEDSFSMSWAKSLGIDVTRLRVMKTNNGVDIFRALCGRPTKEGKRMYEGILDRIIAGTMNINLIVLDSIADMQPPAEENRDFDEMEMAALARFLPRAMRVLRPKVAKANVAMITINHLRDGMNGGQPDYPGGRGYKHNLDIAIRVHASTAADGILLDAKGEKIGHKVICTFEKNRFNVNKRQAEVWLDFRKGVVRLGEEVAMLGASYGVVQRPNNRTWVVDGQQWIGKDNFFAHLDSDLTLRDSIVSRVKRAIETGVAFQAELSEEAKAEAAVPDTFDGEE